MNERISYMGLFNSQFSNPHGLQNALNVSSALDMISGSVPYTKTTTLEKRFIGAGLILTSCYKRTGKELKLGLPMLLEVVWPV